MKRAGVDTGGTFTDFVLLENGKLTIKKLLSIPENPALAVLKGVGKKPVFLIHGTTVATNAFLEGKTAKTAFITTKGFRNILQIGRQTRINLYSLNPEKAPGIIPEGLCFALRERTRADGSIEIPIDLKELKRLAQELKQNGTEAVAVLFLHSYKNPHHEKRAKEKLSKFFKVSVSHEVLMEHREYERAVATALNASLLPILEEYISKLKENLKGKINIMNSAGGYISADMAKTLPVLTLLSGPAGGVIASHNLGSLLSLNNIITLDMGGTSTDVSLIKGQPAITRTAILSHLPLRIPMIEIQTVGAGGGSIAYIDEGGALKVGPKSAGADPGPACYGKSEIPTITDALAVLGRIPEEVPLGGNLYIHLERSFKTIEKIAKNTSKDIYSTAQGILEVSLAKMERALRVVSLERGEDPKEFHLFAFGGAGGIVAAELAERMGIRETVIPPYQGVFSAFGMLLANAVREYTKSILVEIAESSISEAEKRFREMEDEAEENLMSMGIEKQRIMVQRFAEMRYRGQGYEISVPYIPDPEALKARFEHAHERLYFHTQKSPVEIVNLRLRAIGITEKPPIPELKSKNDAEFKIKKIFFKGETLHAKFYKRAELGAGEKLQGPSIAASSDGTIFIPPAYFGTVGKYGEIRIRRGNV